MKRFIIKTILKGLSIVVPVLLSAYLLYFFVTSIEQLSRSVADAFSMGWAYFPGLGILLVIGITFLFGLLMHQWLTRKLLDWFDRLFRKIPLFGSIYSPIKDMLNVISGDMTENLGSPVVVKLPNSNLQVLGFLVGGRNQTSSKTIVQEGYQSVFVQMGYQIGGFTIMVPEDYITSTELTSEEGFRWALTAGLSGTNQ